MARNPGTSTVVTEHDRRRIIEARERKRMTFYELAERCGLSHYTLRRIESGKVTSTPKLRDVYKALRIPVKLIGRPDPDELQLVSAYRQLKESSPQDAKRVVELALELARSR